MNLEIRDLCPAEAEAARALAWEVFLEFEAPDYAQEGIDEFRRFLNDPEQLKALRFFGALHHGVVVGVLAARGAHISLFFVKTEYHRQGVGRALFLHLTHLDEGGKITVNSSPYARGFYRRLGFSETAGEQTANGIRYLPMQYTYGSSIAL